jgi:hypothetical protein
VCSLSASTLTTQADDCQNAGLGRHGLRQNSCCITLESEAQLCQAAQCCSRVAICKGSGPFGSQTHAVPPVYHINPYYRIDTILQRCTSSASSAPPMQLLERQPQVNVDCSHNMRPAATAPLTNHGQFAGEPTRLACNGGLQQPASQPVMTLERLSQEHCLRG